MFKIEISKLQLHVLIAVLGTHIRYHQRDSEAWELLALLLAVDQKTE